MKLLILCCLGLSLVSATDQEYGVGSRKYKISDKRELERQRGILRLFENSDSSTPFSLEHYKGTNSAVAEEFLVLKRRGLLAKNKIFSIFRENHRKEAISLFKLFYYAENYDVLYRTALTVKNSVNRNVFVYALSTALAHRSDTHLYVLPPIYEIKPFYFFGSEAIEEARTAAKNHQDAVVFDNTTVDLDYYLKDVGINAFYYYCSVYYPFWMDGEEFGLKNDRRGEQFYYLLQQFLTRFTLEVPSNHDGGHRHQWSLVLNPGVEESRPRKMNLIEVYRLKQRVEDYMRRIRDAVDAGFALKGGQLLGLYKEGTIDTLGSMVEGNPDSINPRFYGPLHVDLFKLIGEGDGDTPSPLEHFETVLRNHHSYHQCHQILLLFFQYKNYLPPYAPNELNFPGVTIKDIEFDRLTTFFDYFESDLRNIATPPPSNRLKIKQRRLNHRPFTYKINLESNQTSEVVVRLYLGPKHHTVEELNQNRNNFVEIDTFVHKLATGDNLIKRNSRQTYWYVPDRTTIGLLEEKISEAIEKKTEFQLDSSEAFYGLPQRLLLPKGSAAGRNFQFYVIVKPYEMPQHQKKVQQKYYFHKVGTGMNYVDDYAFGFPFDRRIEGEEFNVPNSMFQDVVIYHKELED